MRMFSFRLLLIFIFSINAAQAKDLCTVFRNYTPLPAWYGQLCGGAGAGGGFDGLKSVVGGAYSTFADAFSLNPASLPTVQLPPGVELVASGASKGGIGQPRFAVNAIKGFSGAGAGIGMDSNNSIYSNRSNSSGARASSFTPAAALPSVNLAGAISMASLLKNASPTAWMPKIGAVLRYNNDSKNISPGMGISSNLGPVSLGLSAIREQAAQFYNPTTVFTGSVGIHILYFQADYTIISNVKSSTYSGITSFTSSAVSLFGLSGNIAGFTLNAALRKDSAQASIYHLGLQYVFSTHIALAYLYNYIPGYQSLGLQVMF